MKIGKLYLKLIFICILLYQNACTEKNTKLDKTVLPISNTLNRDKLREGDIVFLSIPNALYRRIAEGTDSPASHVGILLKNEKSNWIVAESTILFSKYTPLDDFLAKSDNGWCCVRRLNRDLTAEELQSIKSEINERMGILYHTGFKYKSRRLFCSKLVYDVFLNAVGLRVGKLETFKQLLTKKPNTSLTFWRFWYFGFIPWSRITVTPASQMESDELTTVYLSTS